MTVSMVMKYLVNRLGLEHESQVHNLINFSHPMYSKINYLFNSKRILYRTSIVAI